MKVAVTYKIHLMNGWSNDGITIIDGSEFDTDFPDHVICELAEKRVETALKAYGLVVNISGSNIKRFK